MHRMIWRVSEMSSIGNPPPDGVVEVSRDEICDVSDKVGPLPRFLIFAFCPSYPS